MPQIDKDRLFETAAAIVRANDRGTYSVPTSGLYPFQWNWDSAFVAIGQRFIDERRAWTELETLAAHQWPDGMIPHIIFHVFDDGYFPGPKVWNCGSPTPTSGISNPPVLGYAIERLFFGAKDTRLAREKAAALLPKAAAWHRWFYANRDPLRTGLVAILHPWESGRDNSVDWDAALARVPTEGITPYQRRDTQHVNAAQRPTKAEYDRYLWLVERFRGLGWDNTKLHDASPFRMVDPGFNAILVRADEAVAKVATALGMTDMAREAEARMAKARPAFDTLWSEAAGEYLCYDRVAGILVESRAAGGFLPLFAGLGDAAKQARIATTVRRWREKLAYGVATHDPADPRFEPQRYWRGPCWLIMNHMLSAGLRRVGETATADEVVADSLELVANGGFAEYYNPVDGSPLGGRNFTWTAAMAMDFIRGGE